MTAPVTFTANARRILRDAATAHGFDVDTASGRVLLASWSGIEEEALRSIFADSSEPSFETVASLWSALSVPVGSMIPSPDSKLLLSIFGFHGNSPVSLSVPKNIWRDESRELFYLLVRGDNYGTGAPNGSWFIGSRDVGSVKPGMVYVVSTESGDNIMTCRGEGSEGKLPFTPFGLEAPESVTWIDDPSAAIAVDVDGAMNRQHITGRIIGQYQPLN